MQQTKIVVLTDVEVRIGDPVSVPIGEQGRIGQPVARRDRADRHRVAVLGKPVEDGPASLRRLRKKVHRLPVLDHAGIRMMAAPRENSRDLVEGSVRPRAKGNDAAITLDDGALLA